MAYIANDEDQLHLSWLGSSTLTVHLDGATTGGQLMAMSSVLSAGDAAPVHVHNREDEVFLLVSGSALVWVGDNRYEVGPGGVAFLPRDIPHTYRITSDDTHMVTLCTPAGMEGFFRSAGHDLATPAPVGWEVSQEALRAAADAHGITLLGPPRTD